MRLHSRQVGFEQLLRQEDIPHGISHLLHSLRRQRPVRPFASLLHFVLIRVKHWIKKPLCFVPWKLLASRQSVLCVCSVIQRQPRYCPPSAQSRNISWWILPRHCSVKILFLPDGPCSVLLRPRARRWMTITSALSVNASAVSCTM